MKNARTQYELRKLDRRVDGLSAGSGASVPSTRLINTTAPLTGGSSLSGDLTLGISAATGAAAGSMSGTDKAKLDGIAAGATANSPDASLRDRATHTGSQLASTISDFAATVRATVLTGLSTASAAAIAATDTVLSALGKLQAQISALPAFASGTWTPTVAGTANVASVGTIQLHHYTRVGNEVSFSGTFTVTPTAASTVTQASVTLPIASTLGDTLNDASGVANASTTTGFVRSDGAGKLLVQFTSLSTAAHAVRISGHYRIN